MIRRQAAVAILVCGFALLCATSVSAHTTGASWNAPAGSYTVDVGYDPTTFTAGEYTRFDFLLWKGAANTGAPATFSQVWVRIMSADKSTLLATGIWKQPIGPTTLLFEFTEPGAYTLETSYRDQDGNDIAVASFPITVNRQAADGMNTALIDTALFLAGGLCGGLVFYVIRRRRT